MASAGDHPPCGDRHTCYTIGLLVRVPDEGEEMIKKNKVLVTLMDHTFDSGCFELGPVWHESTPNNIYVTMKWESEDGPQNRPMSLDIDELKNAIRLIEDTEYE